MRLEEAEEVLGALRRGEVDALVVKPGRLAQIWSLNGVDHVYRVLFETLNEGALTLSSDGIILYSNTQFAGLVGRRLQRVMGASFVDFLQEADVPLFRVLLERGLRRSSKGELGLLKPDGTQVPVMLSLNAVEIEQIGMTCTVVVSDLTELKEVQNALAETNDQLEARVERRTTELRAEIARRERLEKDLQERAEQLAEADRRKDEFLAMLGHELRNPLAPITNAVEVLRLRGSQDAAVVRARQVIDRQVRHMARLVDDLLDVSRITRGTIELKREPVDLRPIVEAAANATRPQMEHAGQHLSITVPPESCWMAGDPTRLEQVVCNLLINASKYTPRDGHIDLSLEKHGTWAELVVRDDGRGVPPEMLPRLFDLFTQIDTSLDRSRGGLGIGLTVVRSLVQLHGGTVHAYSDGLGKGSEFLVRLPLLPVAPAQAGRPSPEQSRPTRSRRVLIVEDNLDSAETLAELLKLWGHEVRVAHHAQVALDLARAFRPEVAILDIGLPETDGYELARSLRQTFPPQDLRLLALTGYGQEGDRERALAAGFERHLTKPLDPDELRAVLEQCSTPDEAPASP